MSTGRRKRAKRAEYGRSLFGGEKPARSASSVRREAHQPKMTRRKSMLILSEEEQLKRDRDEEMIR